MCRLHFHDLCSNPLRTSLRSIGKNVEGNMTVQSIRLVLSFMGLWIYGTHVLGIMIFKLT